MIRDMQPEEFVIYYEDSAKVAAWQQQYGTEQPDPADMESAVDAFDLDQARTIAQGLDAQGHGAPRIYRRVDRTPDYGSGWDWSEEFVEDL